MTSDTKQHFRVISNPDMEEKEKLRTYQTNPNSPATEELRTYRTGSDNPLREKFMKYVNNEAGKRFTVEDLLNW